MKTYGDEEFLYLLQLEEEWKHRKADHINYITDGYIILHDETVPFQEVPISDFGFTILVPEAFEVMPKPLLVVKYPDILRPHYVLSSAGTTMNLVFVQEEDNLLPEQTETVRDEIRSSIFTAQNVEEVYGSQTTLAGEIKVASFDFISFASDSEIYNRMFLFSIHNRMILGNFTCLLQNRYDWKEIILQMFQSVKVF